MATNTKSSQNKSRKVESINKPKNRRNLSKTNLEKTIILNFRVPSEFKKDFKITAVTNGITQSELLKKAFEEWKKRHG